MNTLRAKYNAAAAPAPLSGETFNGKTLSEIASAIAAVEAQETFGYAEARGYGAGSDCDGLIHQGRDRRVQEILDAAGIANEEAFNALVEQRTSAKWSYFGMWEVEGRILRREYPEL